MSSFVSFCCCFRSIQPIKIHPAHCGTLWHLALIQYLGNHEPFEKESFPSKCLMVNGSKWLMVDG